MKYLIALIFLVFGLTFLYAATDYQCQSDCLNKGYMYAYCEVQCNYDDDYTAPKQVDYTCMSNCQNRGYMYNYCKEVCSY